MRPNTISPINASRQFNIRDLFFSTTDRRGVITSWNDVFVEIAGYDSEELLGQAHNIIRHPDMPRCVFKLLWDYLLAGDPIGAYVKNMAKTGEYYWVFAMVVPIETGFLSVRLKPTSAFLAPVQGLYSHLLSIEAAAEKDWKKGMADAAEVLGRKLGELGFASYDEFMAQALGKEVRLRQLNVLGSRIHSDQERALSTLFDNISKLVSLRDLLTKKQLFFAELGRDITLVALNARVAASKLSGAGQTLGVISEVISSVATGITQQSDKLSSAVNSLGELPNEVSFTLAYSTLLSEMSLYFQAANENHDLSEDEQFQYFGASYAQSSHLLESQYNQALQKCDNVMVGISDALREFHAFNRGLNNLIVSLKMGYFTGKSTSVSVSGAEQFSLLLQDMNDLSDTASRELLLVKESLTDVNNLVGAWRRSRMLTSMKRQTSQQRVGSVHG